MLEGESLTLVCGRNLDSNPEAVVEWRDPNGNAANNLTNGGNELVLTRTFTRTDAGNWTCTVSVTGPNGEDLPLSPIVRTITVTVVGECMECYTCSTIDWEIFVFKKFSSTPYNDEN